MRRKQKHKNKKASSHWLFLLFPKLMLQNLITGSASEIFVIRGRVF